MDSSRKLNDQEFPDMEFYLRCGLSFSMCFCHVTYTC